MDSFLTDIYVFGIPAPAARVLTIIAIIAGGWIICPVLVLFSSRSEGGAKFGWSIIALSFSWLGFAVFLIVTQMPRDRHFLQIRRDEPHL